MDLFLSYNSVDHNVVENIARRLRDQGLEPFLDRWNLAPGMRWRSKLEETLSSCKAIAIFVGAGEMGTWQQRELDVALELQSRNPSLPIIPVLLPGCEPPLGFLRQLTWVDLRSQTLERGLAILIRTARGEVPGPDLQRQFDSVRASICPYRGFLHFREEDAPFFFGREAAIEGLVNGVKHHPFLALVGASGSGKSSVVRAGLVPRLRSDRGTTWEFIALVPTDQPLRSLSEALVPFLEPTKSEIDRLKEASKLAGLFAGGVVSLYDVGRRILDKQRDTDRVLIFVDQFEELYTLVEDDAARRKFVDQLITASTVSGSKLTVAITLRGDFVGRAFAYRALSDRLQGAQINLGPMTREELESAILKPAEKIQLEFESGLVRRILDDVGNEPGNLSLLEFVLKELWEKRNGHILLNETYDAIGGLQGAVATKADELFKGLSSADQKIFQRVFLRLVRPSESGRDARRRAAFSELPPEGADLVVKFAKERLLVTNQSASDREQMVEVAHEALISNWGTLRSWVNEEREFLLWRERTDSFLIQWERFEKNEDALLRGPLLLEAQRWFDQRNEDLSDRERNFIARSLELSPEIPSISYPYHVFLSHSDADKLAVEELARRLAREGIRAWLDKWHLIPGDPWQPAIENALAESRSCAVFVGPSGFSPFQNEDMRAAIDRRVRLSNGGFRIIPVLLPGAKRAERSSLPKFLAGKTWIEFRDSLDDQDAFHRLLCGIRGIEPRPGPDQALYEGQCPYRGLRAFGVTDAPFFFGREAEVEWLLNQVRASAEWRQVNRFLAIVGASGSGKSSVVQAGLVAAMNRGSIESSAAWPVAICRPGADPIKNLAAALSPVANGGQGLPTLGELIEQIQNSEKALHLVALRRLPGNAPDMRLVVVVDQFEEVFTLCRSEELRDAFIKNLLYAAKVPQGQTVVILTIRADVYGKCAENAELASALSDHSLVMGPMTDLQLRRSIESPAILAGCELDTELVDLLLLDVHNEPNGDALTLLQHALLELWNKREGRRLTVTAYQGIGKLKRALQKRADAILNAFSKDEQNLSRRIFLRLTQLGDGTEGTKHRVSLHELSSWLGESAAMPKIIYQLADASLLTIETTGDDTFIEIAQEALLRRWPQLRQWIDAERARSWIERELTADARRWGSSGRDDSLLYRGMRLAIAKEWADTHAGQLTGLDEEFLGRCITASERANGVARMISENIRRWMAPVHQWFISKPKSPGDALYRLTSESSRKEALRDDELESLLASFIKCTKSHLGNKPSFAGGFCAGLITIQGDWRGLNLSNQMPLIVPRRSLIGEDDMRSIHELLTTNEESPPRIAIVLNLSERREAKILTDAAKQLIRSTYACDVAVLSSEDVRRISTSSEPDRVLRSVVLAQVDLISVSPFIITGPAPPGMFVGREAELREIEDQIATTSFALIGGRRIGKSSILLRLHNVSLQFKDFYTLYFDCSTTPDAETFRNAHLHGWVPRAPSGNVATFADLVDSPRRDEKLVLLLDEADKLVPADRAGNWPVFNHLRALINSGRVRIVLSGERALQAAMQDSASPLFNLVNKRLLGPLQFHAVEGLVTRPMEQLEIELVDKGAIIHRIYDVTIGHPNVVQRLCRRLIERLNTQTSRRITIDDVNEVIDTPQFQEEDFLSTFWDAAVPLEKIISLILSQHDKPYRIKEVRELLLAKAQIIPSAMETKQALDWLVDLRSILKRSQSGYEFAVKAFPGVLANATTVDDQLEVLVEEYKAQTKDE